MCNPLFIDADHPLFSIGRCWLDGVDVIDRGIIWIDLENQKLCLKAPREQILKGGDIQGEILEGKIEIGCLSGNEEALQALCEWYPALKSYVKEIGDDISL
jgi:hypothetical protein